MTIYSDIIDRVSLGIVKFSHIAFVSFAIVTPFSSNVQYLKYHAILIPSVMFHWYVNYNICCLTLMERHLKNKIYNTPVHIDECISYKIIAPIYDFKKNNINRSKIIYFITGSLWGCTLTKLCWYYYKKSYIQKSCQKSC